MLNSAHAVQQCIPRGHTAHPSATGWGLLSKLASGATDTEFPYFPVG